MSKTYRKCGHPDARAHWTGGRRQRHQGRRGGVPEVQTENHMSPQAELDFTAAAARRDTGMLRLRRPTPIASTTSGSAAR